MDTTKAAISTCRFMVSRFVDRDTGSVRVLNAVQVVNVGAIINPLAHQGQLNGGCAFGVGATLMEELSLDTSGKVEALSLGEYSCPQLWICLRCVRRC